MSIFNSINLTISLLVDTFKQLARWKVWLALISYFSFYWLILYSHYDMMSPLFYTVSNAWAELIGPEQSQAYNHYPAHLALLPYYFGWAKYISGFLLDSTVLGLIALLFYRDEKAEAAGERSIWSGTFSKLHHLIIASVVLNGLFLLVVTYLPQILLPIIEYSPRRRLAYEALILPGMYVLIMAPLFAVIPAIVLKGKTVPAAIMRSWRLFKKYFLTMVFLTIFILFVPVIFSIISSRPEIIIAKFKPELVYWILLGSLVTDLFVKFFWMGTAVKLLSRDSE
jgi:hypothetical protein